MAKRSNFPFREIADRALSSIDTLLGRWLPGGKTSSGEYKCLNPLRADSSVGSFSVRVSGEKAGRWGDFATNDAGKDLISLYAYLYGLEQKEAAIEVADLIGFNLPDEFRPQTDTPRERKQAIVDPATVKPKQKEESPWHPIIPVPLEAPDAPLAHERRGLPAMKWAYKDADGRLLGYVYRFNTSDGGKETLPLTYCKNEQTGKFDWRWMQWPEPNRPLYGLDRLAASPDAWVLLVEGEKCADAPLGMTKGVPVSWPGGSKAVDKCDWTALMGRKIYAWPDCDAQRESLTKEEKEQGTDPLSKPLLPEEKQPGMKAMLRIREKLLALDPTTQFEIIDIPKPGEKPSGWDVADAIAEGMNAPALIEFITKVRPAPSLAVDNSAEQKSISTPNSANAEKENKRGDWYDYLLRKQGSIVACLANVVDILEHDENWKGVIAYDEFAQRVVKLKKPPYWNDVGQPGEWDAQDDARTAMWMTKLYRFSPSAAMVAEGIEVLARSNVVNPPKDWLNSLQWDGVRRVDNWMLDFMGVPFTDYTKRVARWFFMGMVKRVFEPGCKFDYCLVLEGPQGRKKSSALAAIGGEWYGDTDLDLHNKDSMSALRGKMLYEFSELGSVAKAEATKQKSFLSRQVDEYRPVYGRREIRAPRQLIFTGTTNEWEWNKDPTGGRRFWPVAVVQEIDVDGLKESRDQLFAEAVAMVREGLRYWPTATEQADIFDKEQLARTIQESYVDALFEKVNEQVGEFSLHYAVTEWLKIDAAKITRDIQTRVGTALRQLGCTRHEKRTDTLSRFWYKPPERKLATSMSGSSAMDGDRDEEIPF